MATDRNPFTPSFGITPPVLAGRQNLITTFVDGLEDGVGASSRFSMYYGPRGIGKTVLLNAIEGAAKELSWLVVSETCTPGLASRLVKNGLPNAYDRSIGPKDSNRRINSVNVANLAGVGWDNSPSRELGLREWIARITDILEPHDTGLLITLDEIHPKNLNEFVELATVIQHSFREERNLAFAGVALSSSVDALLEGESTTFLRRADWHELGRVSIVEAMEAIAKPIRDNGRTISNDIAEKAAIHADGYCYLIQLIGDLMWKEDPDNKAITEEALNKAVPGAKRRLGRTVLAPELSHLPDVQRSYLLAMAQEIRDNGEANTGALSKKIGATKNYANVYRERLIQRGLIFTAGHGLVDFVTPGMGEYILEHTP